MSTSYSLDGPYPSVQYKGTETTTPSYCEDWEVNGVMFRTQNATYSTTGNTWSLRNSSLPAFATAVGADGVVQHLTMSAGSSAWTTWWGGSSTTGVFNVNDFLQGSGTVTLAIQNAIYACVGAGGGTVFFPPGVYEISSPLLIPWNEVGTITVILQGCGPASTIQIAASDYSSFNSAGVFQIGYESSGYAIVIIRDLQIDGNRRGASSPSASEGYGVLPGSGWLMERVLFYDMNASAVAIGTDPFSLSANDVTMIDCQFDTPESGAGAQQPSIQVTFPSSYLRIARCRWNPHFVAIESGVPTLIDLVDTTGVMIEDCVFECTAQSSVILEGVVQGHIRGCQFLAGNNLIVRSDYLINPDSVICPADFQIIENYFEGYNGTNTPLNNACIYVGFVVPNEASVNPGGNVVVAGNTLNQPYGCGILWDCDLLPNLPNFPYGTSYGGHIIAENSIINANHGRTTGTVDAPSGSSYKTSGIVILNSVGMIVSSNCVQDVRPTPYQYYALVVGPANSTHLITGLILVQANILSGAINEAYSYTQGAGGSVPPIIRGNIGANPIGFWPPLALQPAVPNGTPPARNSFGADIMVYVTAASGEDAGPVGIAIRGATGLLISIIGVSIAPGTSATFRVPAGGAIAPSWSASDIGPSWTWFAD